MLLKLISIIYISGSGRNILMKRPCKSFSLGELFAGAGGMALGAERARYRKVGFRHVWVNDVCRDACDTFNHNLSIDGNVYCCDVRSMDFGKVASIDGLVFGFPCNDFSLIGEMKGIVGPYGGLYRSGIRALENTMPLFFVAENVSGLAASGHKNDFDVITMAMKNAGYNVFSTMYNFENYNVPQCRKRIIFVGFRNDLGITKFKYPNAVSKDNPITCFEALKDIPENAKNHEFTRQSDRVVERLDYIKRGQNAFTADMPDDLRLCMNSGAKFSQIYRRLTPDRPAYTVTASGGGGTHMYHWTENRALTNRERARLQTFPDTFEFFGSKESVRKQIGMAVPPVGIKFVFKQILQVLYSKGIKSQC